MRPFSTLSICLCFLACSRSNEAKQEFHQTDSAKVSASGPQATTFPTVQGPATFERGGIFELGQPVDIRNVGLRDTILVKHIGIGLLALQTSGKFVPLARSFRMTKYQIDSATKDSVGVIIEELTAPRNSDARGRSEGRFYLVWKGLIAIADTDDVGVQEDSSLNYVMERSIYTVSLGNSKSLLVICETSSPSYPSAENFRAYGINKNGALVEFPGLNIKDSRELPDSLYDGQILTWGRNHGCIEYETRLRFDMNDNSFVTLPEDSGYEARGIVDQRLFENAGDTVRINVFQRPTSESEREYAAITRKDTVSVTRLLNRGIAVWVRILRNGKVLGWIDDAGIETLQLNACD